MGLKSAFKKVKKGIKDSISSPKGLLEGGVPGTIEIGKAAAKSAPVRRADATTRRIAGGDLQAMLMGGGPDTMKDLGLSYGPKPPKAENDLVIPMVDEEAVARYRRRSAADSAKRGGRSSTILTAGTGNLLG